MPKLPFTSNRIFSIELFSKIISLVAFILVAPDTSSIKLFRLVIAVLLLPISVVIWLSKSNCSVVKFQVILFLAECYNYWTQVNAVEISYPYTISVDKS